MYFSSRQARKKEKAIKEKIRPNIVPDSDVDGMLVDSFSFFLQLKVQTDK